MARSRIRRWLADFVLDGTGFVVVDFESLKDAHNELLALDEYIASSGGLSGKLAAYRRIRASLDRAGRLLRKA